MKKHVFFSSQRVHKIVAEFQNKTSRFREVKKKFRKKPSSFREIKYIFRAMFFLLVFSSPSLTFFSNRSKVFFILSPSITFPEIYPMFFIWSPSLTFSKISSMFFCLNFFSALPHVVFLSKTEKLNIVALKGPGWATTTTEHVQS